MSRVENRVRARGNLRSDDRAPHEKASHESLVGKLGPGLITGAADDDPSGIATYSQGGAQFGYSLLWTLFFTYPLMVGIQVVSARIGRVSGYGLAGNIRRHYPKWVLYGLVSLLLAANTINIGADLSAMADATALLIGGSRHAYILGFGLFCVVLQIYFTYARYVRVLKWLTLSLFAYVGVVFSVDLPWSDVMKGVFVPSLSTQRGLLNDRRSNLRNHHQPLSLFLAGFAGMRGPASRQGRQTPAQPSRPGGTTVGQDQGRYLYRDGLLELDRVFYHAHHSRYVACPWCD